MTPAHDEAARSEVEGTYTEADGHPPVPHTVHGRYTAEDEDHHEQSTLEGGYTNTGTDPHAHDRDGQIGHFTDHDE